MRLRATRLREIERWIAWVRLAAIPFAIFQVAIVHGYPPGYELAAWATAGALGVGGALLFVLSGREFSRAAQGRLGLLSLSFDFAVVSAFAILYHWAPASPARQLFFLPVVQGALRFGLWGGVVLAAASAPALTFYEALRADRYGGDFRLDYITFQVGIELLMALIIGWLVGRLRRQTTLAESRAVEAESLRDELGRRVDLLDAANRCARALASSLDLDEAYRAFIRELRGLLPFDRVAIVLVEDGRAEVMAVAGAGAHTVMPPGTARSVSGSVLEEVLEGRTVVRQDMREPAYPEERALIDLGLNSRLVAPLLVGARSIGMVVVCRREPNSFGDEDVELVSLLGRLVATAVQNIRAYEAERETVEELRRLSALRADFVSLVSHELRSPMAAVIGASRTLESRWRSLSAEQRESFLALIAGETSRLATLIGDVLDTSRIEAGTFSFAFDDVDVGDLVRETVTTAGLGQDEVRVQASVAGSLPPIRADRDRIRQVLMNLIDNAVKYSEAGGEVQVVARPEDGTVRVEVTDQGPGIPRDQQRLIFEKFARAQSGHGRPGTGLGLFIARSIAEAHGGSIDVRSAPAQGSTFTLSLPVDSPP